MLPTTPKEHSVWLEGTQFPTCSQELPQGSVDVAVIGAGITGLAAARELARRGASVVVLERQSVGWGASSRNGGMVLTGLKLGAAELVEKYGLGRARRLFDASVAAIDCVEQIVREEQLDCCFERCGHLLVAAKPAHMQAIEAEAALLAQEFGHQTTIVEREQLATEIGSPRYYGGLVDPASAAVNPARYVAGLAQAALHAGAQIVEHAPVQRVVRERGDSWLATPQGMVRAKQVFVATGGYCGALTPTLQRKIFPLGSFIIATEPLPPALARELLPQGRMVFDSKHLLFYFRLTPDRRMLFGGRAAFFPESEATVRKSATILRRDMLSVFPQLREARIDYAWGGVLDVSFDLMPHIGQADGMHYAVGYAGHGVAMASYQGTLVARRLAGERLESPFDGLPFPGAPLGLYNGRPWFLPLAAAMYTVRDMVE